MKPPWLPTQAVGEFAIASFLLGLGGYVFFAAHSIKVPKTVDSLGPRFFPYIIGALLMLVSVWLIVDILRGRYGQPEGSESGEVVKRTDWRTLGLVTVVIVSHIYLLEVLGYIVAAGGLFWATAVVLGAKHWIRAGIIGFVLSTITYVGFAYGLEMPLPLPMWMKST